MYSRIVIPLDGSPLAEQALPHAIVQAEKFGAELTLLRVVEPFVHLTGMSLGDLDRIRQQTNTWAEKYLERVAADVRERGIQALIKVVHGSAPLVITQFAESNEADLIVMSTRGRSGIGRWLMGSVADRVVRGAAVPVLLVPTRGESRPCSVRAISQTERSDR